MLKHMLPPLFSALASAPSCIVTHAPRGLRPRGPPSSFAAISFTTTKMSTESYTFGPYKIRPEEVFYSTQLSYALVNLRPVVPGRSHGAALYSGVNFPLSGTCLWLLWIKREVKRFVDLSADEITDLWLTAQKVGSQLEHYHRASSLTFTIQDGPQAGQTVPHVHIHILPRKVGDFERNDEIYDAIDEKEKDLTKKLDLDKERTNRSLEEMSLEADEYRKLF